MPLKSRCDLRAGEAGTIVVVARAGDRSALILRQAMQATLAAVLLTGTFTIYPGPALQDDLVEAITDRGPILEMIVRCHKGTAIISYSKMERLYCDPRLACSASKASVIRRACG